MEYVSRIKFYADTPSGEKNKYFCWKVESILKAEERIVFFMKKGWNIRAAWFETIAVETKEVIENLRFNVQEVFERISFSEAQKKYLYKKKLDEIISAKCQNLY